MTPNDGGILFPAVGHAFPRVIHAAHPASRVTPQEPGDVRPAAAADVQNTGIRLQGKVGTSPRGQRRMETIHTSQPELAALPGWLARVLQ